MVQKLLILVCSMFLVISCSSESAESMEQQANSGNAEAQYKLGYQYQWKQAEPDFEQARYWYEKAAGQGFAAAQSELAGLYQNGLGVSIDNNKAIELYTLAADQNDANGLAKLGYMYDEGIGVEENDEKALEYYKRAAELGNKFAKTQVFMMGK